MSCHPPLSPLTLPQLKTQAGSRVRFELNGVVATFHRPHPDKEAKPYQVRDARAFLEQAGVVP
ncbi:type II toxin-antitoxin system HicA family toxin [Pseudomonas sp. NPDC090202]|uniref:type II toxin-antitoxin system HicA family toxin n=1 Tax=unclassified Pseudomonas TaxID=196821 RepID=UPI0037F773BA